MPNFEPDGLPKTPSSNEGDAASTEARKAAKQPAAQSAERVEKPLDAEQVAKDVAMVKKELGETFTALSERAAKAELADDAEIEALLREYARLGSECDKVLNEFKTAFAKTKKGAADVKASHEAMPDVIEASEVEAAEAEAAAAKAKLETAERAKAAVGEAKTGVERASKRRGEAAAEQKERAEANLQMKVDLAIMASGEWPEDTWSKMAEALAKPAVDAAVEDRLKKSGWDETKAKKEFAASYDKETPFVPSKELSDKLAKVEPLKDSKPELYKKAKDNLDPQVAKEQAAYDAARDAAWESKKTESQAETKQKIRAEILSEKGKELVRAAVDGGKVTPDQLAEATAASMSPRGLTEQQITSLPKGAEAKLLAKAVENGEIYPRSAIIEGKEGQRWVRSEAAKKAKEFDALRAAERTFGERAELLEKPGWYKGEEAAEKERENLALAKNIVRLRQSLVEGNQPLKKAGVWNVSDYQNGNSIFETTSEDERSQLDEIDDPKRAASLRRANGGVFRTLGEQTRQRAEDHTLRNMKSYQARETIEPMLRQTAEAKARLDAAAAEGARLQAEAGALKEAQARLNDLYKRTAETSDPAEAQRLLHEAEGIVRETEPLAKRLQQEARRQDETQRAERLPEPDRGKTVGAFMQAAKQNDLALANLQKKRVDVTDAFYQVARMAGAPARGLESIREAAAKAPERQRTAKEAQARAAKEATEKTAAEAREAQAREQLESGMETARADLKNAWDKLRSAEESARQSQDDPRMNARFFEQLEDAAKQRRETFEKRRSELDGLLSAARQAEKNFGLFKKKIELTGADGKSASVTKEAFPAFVAGLEQAKTNLENARQAEKQRTEYETKEQLLAYNAKQNAPSQEAQAAVRALENKLQGLVNINRVAGVGEATDFTNSAYGEAAEMKQQIIRAGTPPNIDVDGALRMLDKA